MNSNILTIVILTRSYTGQTNRKRTRRAGPDQIQNCTKCWNVGHNQQKLRTMVTAAVERPRRKISI